MKIIIKQLAITATILAVITSSQVFASCQWTHGSLGETFQSTKDRMKRYAVCKDMALCGRLETELNETISLMQTASECGPNVLTPDDQYMIGFFNSRFKLIKKQKIAYLGTKVAISPAPAPAPAMIAWDVVEASPEPEIKIQSEPLADFWEDQLIEETLKQNSPNRYASIDTQEQPLPTPVQLPSQPNKTESVQAPVDTAIAAKAQPQEDYMLHFDRQRANLLRWNSEAISKRVLASTQFQ